MELAPSSVTRSIEVPVSAEETWGSLSSGDGLAGWLGDSVVLDAVVAGAAGTVCEGDTVRRLVVTEVEEGRSIGFVWWDEASPDRPSVVTIELAPGTDDRSTTVTVTERIGGSASASLSGASVGGLLDVETAWDRRLRALVGECALTDALV